MLSYTVTYGNVHNVVSRSPLPATAAYSTSDRHPTADACDQIESSYSRRTGRHAACWRVAVFRRLHPLGEWLSTSHIVAQTLALSPSAITGTGVPILIFRPSSRLTNEVLRDGTYFRGFLEPINSQRKGQLQYSRCASCTLCK